MDTATAIPAATPASTAVPASNTAEPKATAGFAALLAQMNIAQGAAAILARGANALLSGTGKQESVAPTAGGAVAPVAANCVPARGSGRVSTPILLSMPDIIAALLNGSTAVETGTADPAGKDSDTPLTQNTTPIPETPDAKPLPEPPKPSGRNTAASKGADKDTKSTNAADDDCRQPVAATTPIPVTVPVPIVASNMAAVLPSVEPSGAAEVSDDAKAHPAVGTSADRAPAAAAMQAAMVAALPLPAAKPVDGNPQLQTSSTTVHASDAKPVAAEPDGKQQELIPADQRHSTEGPEVPPKADAAAHSRPEKPEHPTIAQPAVDKTVRHPELASAAPELVHKQNSNTTSQDAASPADKHDNAQIDAPAHSEPTPANHKEPATSSRQQDGGTVVASDSAANTVQAGANASNATAGESSYENRTPVPTQIERPAAHAMPEMQGNAEPTDFNRVASEPAHVADTTHLQAAVRATAGVAHSEMRVVLNGATNAVEVRAVMHDNQIGAIIGVRDHELRGVLQSEIANLRELLDDRHVALHELSVVDQGASGQSMEQMPSQDRHGNSQQRLPAAPSEAPTLRDVEPVHIETQTHVAAAPGRLSVRV